MAQGLWDVIVTPAMAWARLRGFARAYRLVTPNRETLTRAQHFHLDQRWSFWDAMIVAACLECGVTRLYSEDLPGHSPPEGLDIVNPFG